MITQTDGYHIYLSFIAVIHVILSRLIFLTFRREWKLKRKQSRWEKVDGKNERLFVVVCRWFHGTNESLLFSSSLRIRFGEGSRGILNLSSSWQVISIHNNRMMMTNDDKVGGIAE